MDEAVVKYYRMLLRTGFEHAGMMDDPTIVLDAVQENMRICDHVGVDSLQLRIKVSRGLVERIRYLCTCDPTTNVAVEMLCHLLDGRSLEAARQITPASFLEMLGSESEDLVRKATGLLELLHRGIERYETEHPEMIPVERRQTGANATG